MKFLKKTFAVMLCIAVLACSAAVMSVSAEEAADTAGLRWFPVPENRQNDEAWEAECVADGCLCQRFTENAEATGNTNFLNTEYTAEGGLKLTRSDATIVLDGVDYTDASYWPRIRTLSLETSPAIDLQTYNTLYFDVVVEEGTQWNLSMSFTGMNIGLGKALAEACGNSYDPGSLDAAAGTYKGSINIIDTINAIAADSTHLDTVNASALKNQKKFFVPQLQIYVVGPQGASLTVNSLYLATAEDTTGENCDFVDMGLLSGLGEEYYDLMAEEEPTDEPVDDPTINDPASPEEGPAGDDTPAVGEDETDDTTASTTTTTKKADKDDGGSALPIIIVVVAVVVVAAVVVVIVMKKKKA